MHVAIHSNASPEEMAGLLQGSDIYYRPGSSQNAILSQRFANIVAEELKKFIQILSESTPVLPTLWPRYCKPTPQRC